MLLLFEKLPVERLIEIPFIPLPKLIPHKEELLARMGIHEPVEEPEVGKLPPDVTRHLINHRSLAVDNLIMRKNEDEIFGKCIDESEGQVVMVKLPVDRVLGNVDEHVVHPSHIPFHVETQTPKVDRL